MNDNISISKGYSYKPFGVYRSGSVLQISVFFEGIKNCGIRLFNSKDKTDKGRLIIFDEEYRVGSCFCVSLKNVNKALDTYLLYEDGKYFPDPYSRKIKGLSEFGKYVNEEDLRSCIDTEKFVFDDKKTTVAVKSPFIYLLNVRSFTKLDKSVPEKYRGTYKAVMLKIPYLKALGVSAVELMPVHEIQSVLREKKTSSCKEEQRVNLWGFQDGYYYAPRSAYAYASDKCDKELKELVNALHSVGIEIILQFFFGKDTREDMVLDCIRYWVYEYKIDGAHIKSDNISVETLAKDPLLRGIKLYSNYNYNDSFLTAARHFLKSDDLSVTGFINAMYPNKGGEIPVNYISNYAGFTLLDLVSFEHKQNEANGENNLDGCVDNVSWNCGEEGLSKKKRVNDLRLKQMLNAVSFVMLSSAVPLINAGDEAGNTQGGNNNPYCQDNETGWVLWSNRHKFKKLYDYIKFLSDERNSFTEYTGNISLNSDKAFNYPDISFHGTSAWKPDFSGNSHSIAVMLRGNEDGCLYAVFNMYWDKMSFAPPALPKGMCWKIISDTSQKNVIYEEGKELSQNIIEVNERSVVLCRAFKTISKK